MRILKGKEEDKKALKKEKNMATKRDREILNAVVNPLLPLGEAVFDDDDIVPEDLKDIEEKIDTKTYRDSRGFEREAIREAEAGNIATSFALINQALDLTPERPSCYNNRAQIHRLNADVKSAQEDLNQALKISKGQGRTGCQAYCQRGMIYRLEGRNEEAKNDFEIEAALASMNPYAAMCNQMLKNVFSSLENGSNEVED